MLDISVIVIPVVKMGGLKKFKNSKQANKMEMVSILLIVIHIVYNGKS